MTTAVLDKATYQQINQEAAEVRTGQTVLMAIASLFFAIGWLAGRIVPCLMWCTFAMRKGYRSAHGPSRRMQIAALAAQIEDLQMQLSRFSG